MEITIPKPDDWHVHFRDNQCLATTVAHCAQRHGRALAMPNLIPPIVHVAQADAYRQRILQHVPSEFDFQIYHALYLTEATSEQDVEQVSEHEFVLGFKLYPAGATTNSDSGVKNIAAIYPLLAAMEKLQVPLLIHGEVTDPSIDFFEREKVFIEKILSVILEKFPQLKCVLEHITTRDAVNFVESCDDNVSATITAHHLLFNRNALFISGLNPHFYCLPILKHQHHQQALLEAACSGNPKFFLGSDSAPHSIENKLSACGCAGIYSAPATIELYAQVFEQENALDKLADFASVFGARFYSLSPATQTITLEKSSWTMPEQFQFANSQVVPILAGKEIHWKIKP